MKNFNAGAGKDRVMKILPDQFDPEVVEEFFANTKNPFASFGKAFGQSMADLGGPSGEELRDTSREGDEVETPYKNAGTHEADVDDIDANFAPGKFSKGPSWKSDTETSGGKGGGRKNKQEVVEDTEEETPVEQPASTPEEDVASGAGDPVEEEVPATASEDEVVESAPDPEPVVEEEPVQEEVVQPAPEPAPQPASDNYVTNSADYVTNADNPDAFNISLNFSDAWTESQKLAFIEGAELVSDYVYGDLADVNGIDDVHIEVVTTTWSGWAWGGPEAYREDGTTTEGRVLFSEGNMATMERYDVIDDFAFHEIMHVLGFGTSWGGQDLVEDFDGQLRFTGQNAVEAYNDPDSQYSNVAAGDAGSLDGVPIDADGWHLDRDMLNSEIMSPQLNVSNNIISDLTIAIIEDIGYETVYGDEEDPMHDDFIF